MKKLFILALVLSVVSAASAAELARYELDDNAANTTVAATTGNEGTLTTNSSAISNTSTPFGRPGSSMAFGNYASNNYGAETINIGNPGLPTIPSLTVSTWIKPDSSVAMSHLGGVLGHSSTGVWTGLWNRYGTLSLDYGDQMTGWSSGISIPDDKWSFVAASLDSTGQNVTIYKSGSWYTASKDTTYSGDKQSGSWTIGVFPATYAENSTRAWKGLLDETRIGDGARLSFTELQALLPEPATVILLGMGGLALLRKKRS